MLLEADSCLQSGVEGPEAQPLKTCSSVTGPCFSDSRAAARADFYRHESKEEVVRGRNRYTSWVVAIGRPTGTNTRCRRLAAIAAGLVPRGPSGSPQDRETLPVGRMAHREAARRTAYQRRPCVRRQYRNRRRARTFRRDRRTAGPQRLFVGRRRHGASRMPVWPPAERITTQRFGRPSLVRDGVSSTSSNCRTSTKKRIAAS